jgi:hypothetical protein
MRGLTHEGHDRCPRDGCLDVDRTYRCGGRHAGADWLSWEIFHADPARGGCGYTWSRTTRQGQANDEARGIQSRWLTRAAARAVTYSIPSAAFRAGYERIDWSR